jgi:hypothetical protein
MKRKDSGVGRIDDLIETLEAAHKDADEIFDLHVDELRLRTPSVPFGVLKQGEISGRAGSSLNYVAALKMLRDKFISGY